MKSLRMVVALLAILGLGSCVGGDGAGYPSISADGRFVAYSWSLWSGIDVYDREAGTVERVSVSSSGADANARAIRPSISADGRFIAFSSAASNLVANDTNKFSDVFVRDRVKGTTTRVSVASDGAQANGGSERAAISADGSVVAFASYANNLVPGETNKVDDIFVHDRRTGRTERVNVSSEGVQGNIVRSRTPAISADGSVVVFSSSATGIVPGSDNWLNGIFVRDRVAKTTRRVSVSSTGIAASGKSSDPAISGDGRFVVYWSVASNLIPNSRRDVRGMPGRGDVYIHDRVRRTTVRVGNGYGGAQPNNASAYPALSANGRFVAFSSRASNLVPGDTNDETDVFVLDLHSGTTERVSVSSNGVGGNGDSYGPPAISADGRFVAFFSNSGNLAPGYDRNTEIFVRDRLRGVTERVSGKRAPRKKQAAN